MKAVHNTCGSVLDVDFNGETYHFDKTPVSINEDLFDHLKERYPLAFNFEYSSSKPIAKVKSVKTPIHFSHSITDDGIDMRAGVAQAPKPMFGSVDSLPANGNKDKDGVSWYGETTIEGGK